VAKPILQVVIGSTRPGRVGPAVADWIADRAQDQTGFDVEVADLAELNLPLFDEPEHPRLGRYAHQHTKDWSAIVDRSDALVFVIPEYNHTFNAATKNALDYLHREWQDKPAGIVSYGGGSGGANAARTLEPVLSALRMRPASAPVSIQAIRERVGQDGRLQPTPAMEDAASAMLAELAGQAGRAARPAA
jgi:NAD(P)H-dependent FMN reductase